MPYPDDKIPLYNFGTSIALLYKATLNRRQHNPVAPQQSTSSTKRVHIKNFVSEWCGASRKNKQ